MKFARYAVLLLAALVCSAVLGCRSRSLPATPPLNAAERALQRVVLPGICEFDGRPVNPTNLLAWLSTEATKHDPAARKVTIRIDVDKSDAPPVGQSTQTTFQYRASGGRLTVFLPDAVKFYAAVLGLSYEFGDNEVIVRSLHD